MNRVLDSTRERREILPRIRPEIAALPPYRQGKQAGSDAFKLSSNENPFDPLPQVVAALADATLMNRYPDATARALRERLGERYGVSPDAVHVASGSVAILYQFVQAAAAAGDEVVYAWRSFEAYPGLPLVAGATGVPVPPTADARHDLDAMAAAVTDRTRVVIVCTPNNPTGPIVTRAEFAAFVAAVPQDVLILLDEAYAEGHRARCSGRARRADLRAASERGGAAYVLQGLRPRRPPRRLCDRPPPGARCRAQHRRAAVGDRSGRAGSARQPGRRG